MGAVYLLIQNLPRGSVPPNVKLGGGKSEHMIIGVSGLCEHYMIIGVSGLCEHVLANKVPCLKVLSNIR